MGRPKEKNPKTHWLISKVDAEMAEYIKKIAVDLQGNMSQAIRYIIKEHMEENKDKS